MTTPLTTKKIRISVYLDEDIYEALKNLSKLRKRSMSNLIEVSMEVIANAAKESGELDGDV